MTERDLPRDAERLPEESARLRRVARLWPAALMLAALLSYLFLRLLFPAT